MQTQHFFACPKYGKHNIFLDKLEQETKNTTHRIKKKQSYKHCSR